MRRAFLELIAAIILVLLSHTSAATPVTAKLLRDPSSCRTVIQTQIPSAFEPNYLEFLGAMPPSINYGNRKEQRTLSIPRTPWMRLDKDAKDLIEITVTLSSEKPSEHNRRNLLTFDLRNLRDAVRNAWQTAKDEPPPSFKLLLMLIETGKSYTVPYPPSQHQASIEIPNLGTLCEVFVSQGSVYQISDPSFEVTFTQLGTPTKLFESLDELKEFRIAIGLSEKLEKVPTHWMGPIIFNVE